MKKKLLLALGLVFTISLASVAGAKALNAHKGDVMNVNKGEVVNSSIYRAGRIVKINGTIKGDIYCVGQRVEIRGTVEGDVLCAGQEVRISGQVKGDVRAVGQNITLDGKIMGSASVAAQTINVEKEATIGRDFTAAGQTVHLAGKVGRDMVSTTSLMTASGSIGRNLDFSGDELALYNPAEVGGSLTYTSHKDAYIEKGAAVAGQTQHHQPPQKEKKSHNAWPARLMSPLFWIVTMLVIGGTALLLFPRWFNGTSRLMQRKALPAVGIGFVGLILSPIAAIALMVTVIGIPLGVGLLLLWGIAIAISFTFVAYTAGKMIVDRFEWLEKWPQLAALIVGAALLTLLLHIPYLGFWVGLAALLWGLGGIYMALGYHIKMEHTKPKKAKKA